LIRKEQKHKQRTRSSKQQVTKESQEGLQEDKPTKIHKTLAKIIRIQISAAFQYTIIEEKLVF
jgi:hypothetical protein